MYTRKRSRLGSFYRNVKSLCLDRMCGVGKFPARCVQSSGKVQRPRILVCCSIMNENPVSSRHLKPSLSSLLHCIPANGKRGVGECVAKYVLMNNSNQISLERHDQLLLSSSLRVYTSKTHCLDRTQFVLKKTIFFQGK